MCGRTKIIQRAVLTTILIDVNFYTKWPKLKGIKINTPCVQTAVVYY